MTFHLGGHSGNAQLRLPNIPRPIGGYIVDSYCSELRLVIEIDGDSHAETAEYDLERTRFLNALGLQVVRYTNDEIISNIEGVFDDLNQRIGGNS